MILFWRLLALANAQVAVLEFRTISTSIPNDVVLFLENSFKGSLGVMNVQHGFACTKGLYVHSESVIVLNNHVIPMLNSFVLLV